MKTRPTQPVTPRRMNSSLRPGFSLTEVMFAVIVLGIGFIMVAAIFPVAISQSRLTVEETTGAAAARGALALTQTGAAGGDAGATAPLVPPTDMYSVPPTRAGLAPAETPPTIAIPPNSQITIPGKVMTFNDLRIDDGTSGSGINYRLNLWNAFRGSLILPADPRYAWVPVYRRDSTFVNSQASPAVLNYPFTPTPGGQVSVIRSPFAQVYFIPVAVRNRSTYEVTGGAGNDLDGQLNLLPRQIKIEVQYDGALNQFFLVVYPPDTSSAAAAAIGPHASIAEGAFVIVSDDKITTPQSDMGLMNGRVYRVGTRRTDLDPGAPTYAQVWEFAPGGEFAPDAGRDGIPNTADDITALGNTTAVTTVPGFTASTTISSGPADALVVGRNTTGVAGEFEGVAQDVGVYVTFVRVN